ncbi:MAG: ABC transporter ATP-binding protein [Candidatus Alkanophagales archaeon]|nr:MAG: ABC transporter ATP-binding protein [Candidatus Alkanophagales archaeon]
MLEVIRLKKVYEDGTEALREVSFSVREGETCSIIGPSGCGKTTLLLILAGLLKPTAGEVWVNGERITRPRRETALILQDYGLFPWKTVYENVALGLKLRGCEDGSFVKELLRRLGLASFERHYPRQLSGGMQQRVAIARALALRPKILLCDEPFSSLDALTRESMQNFMLKLWHSGVTFVLVTHNIEEAVFLGRKIVVLSQRPAEVVKILGNPRAGDPLYRSAEDFFEKCREVRGILRDVLEG